MPKMITGQNNTAAYVIPRNQCRVNSTVHYITMYSIVYNGQGQIGEASSRKRYEEWDSPGKSRRQDEL